MKALMVDNIRVNEDVTQLAAFLPVPGQGYLAVNSFLIHGAEPLLVDTGLAGLADEFERHLRALVDPAEIRWIWLTHMDPDHIGNLRRLLALAPEACLVTNFLGAGKLALWGIEHSHMKILESGQTLDVAGRETMALTPPSYDAPETMGLVDLQQKMFFSSDCFGAVLPQVYEDLTEVSERELAAGMKHWALVDSPWLETVSKTELIERCAPLRDLDINTIASSHLPAGANSTERLLSAYFS